MAFIPSKKVAVKSAEPNTSKPLVWPNYGSVSVGTSPPSDSAQTSPKADCERKRLAGVWSALLVVVAASQMTACASLTTTYVKPEIPVSLTQPCESLPDIPDRSELSVAQWIVDAVTIHSECAKSKLRLIEALK